MDLGCASSIVTVCISIFSCAHLTGTCICSDLAATTSSSKYQRLYLQCYLCVGFCHSIQTLSLLVTYRKILNFDHWMIALSCISALFLITICACYLTIRAKLSSIGFAAVAGKGNSLEQNKKLSRAFFTVTAASLVCWAPSSVGYFIFHLSSKRCPMAVVHSFYIFYLGNSLVNPIIYSFKFPMFRKTLRKMRLKKTQYRVS